MTESPEHDASALFWDCAGQLYDTPGVEEGTIFGFRCLRVDEQFVGLPANGELWVKLPEARVNELIDEGIGEECRPNGRRFREWMAVRHIDEGLWIDLLEESIDFVRPDRSR